MTEAFGRHDASAAMAARCLLALGCLLVGARGAPCSGSIDVQLQPAAPVNVTDHDGGGDYPTGAMCKWSLIAPPGYVVKLQMHYFASGGASDSLSIFNAGEYDEDQLIATYAGRGTGGADSRLASFGRRSARH